jgi:hypothetical protein
MIVFTFICGDPLTSLDLLPQSIFNFGSINGSQNSFHVSKKFLIVIGTRPESLFPRRENK